MLERWSLALGPVFSAGFAATIMAVTDVHGGALTLVGGGGHDGGARAVLVHGDFNPGKIMRSDTGWLAIVDVCAGRAIRWGRVRAALALSWYRHANDPARAAAEVGSLRAWCSASA